MIIIQQVVGTDLTELVIDENKFQTETGATTTMAAVFEYDGADWAYDGTTITEQQLEEDYGISFTGTPVATDTILVAYEPQDLHVFSAGKGINQAKINYNFAELQQETNTNETAINNIANTALLKDGSNLTQDIVDDFQKQTPIILSGNGDINLTDNKVHFLTLTNNNSNRVVLPTPVSDNYSHTIVLIVQGSAFSLNVANGTAGHLYNDTSVNKANTYSVMYIYNKIDNHWYYSLTQ